MDLHFFEWFADEAGARLAKKQADLQSDLGTDLGALAAAVPPGCTAVPRSDEAKLVHRLGGPGRAPPPGCTAVPRSPKLLQRAP